MQTNLSKTSKTLWIGDLQTWMDEPFLQKVISSIGYDKELAHIKMIKDKTTGLPLKYGFLEFNNHHNANLFYLNYNNKPIPITNAYKLFKLNWAAYEGSNKAQPNHHHKHNANNPNTQDIQVYVGNLQHSVSQITLLEFFKMKYPSAYLCKIITDNTTKLSKGYGFVKFTNSEQSQRVIQEMNGKIVFGKAIKVCNAFEKGKEEAVVQNQEIEGILLMKQKLFTQFYAYINNQQTRPPFQNAILNAFGGKNLKKPTFKESLQSIKPITYLQTSQSQKFLQLLPREIIYSYKVDLLNKIYD